MTLIIPPKIHVGYQSRSDTYTGQLGYVIYYDRAGKRLNKEKSFNSWRDKNITPHDFDNVPTEGFVLNKKVGDYKGSWFDSRRAAVRVYDPRNFEFEITVDNLLMILEYSSSIKGKGLEGKFLYCWDAGDLYLIPENSDDYKEAFEFTKLQNQKVGSKELKPGHVYKFKNETDNLYLGKLEFTDVDEAKSFVQYNIMTNEIVQLKPKKNFLKSKTTHIFKDLESNTYKPFISVDSPSSKIAHQVSIQEDEKFAEIHAEYLNSPYHAFKEFTLRFDKINNVVKVRKEGVKFDGISYGFSGFMSFDDSEDIFYSYYIHTNIWYTNKYEYFIQKIEIQNNKTVLIGNPIKVETSKISEEDSRYGYSRSYEYFMFPAEKVVKLYDLTINYKKLKQKVYVVTENPKPRK